MWGAWGPGGSSLVAAQPARPTCLESPWGSLISALQDLQGYSVDQATVCLCLDGLGGQRGRIDDIVVPCKGKDIWKGFFVCQVQGVCERRLGYQKPKVGWLGRWVVCGFEPNYAVQSRKVRGIKVLLVGSRYIEIPYRYIHRYGLDTIIHYGPLIDEMKNGRHRGRRLCNIIQGLVPI